MVLGLDLSFGRVTPQWCDERKAERYQVLVQCLGTGAPDNDLALANVAAPNLAAARGAGLSVAGYLNATPRYSPAQLLYNASHVAGPEWPALTVVFVDVEIAGVGEDDIKGLADLLVAWGRKTAIYTRRGFWLQLGNPTWPWLAGYKLWNAYYDGDPDVDFPAAPYGPWTAADVVGEQYQGTTNLDGVDVDLNTFDAAFFEEGDVTKDEAKEAMREVLREPLAELHNKSVLQHLQDMDNWTVDAVGRGMVEGGQRLQQIAATEQ